MIINCFSAIQAIWPLNENKAFMYLEKKQLLWLPALSTYE
jgi:hypothetical protein